MRYDPVPANSVRVDQDGVTWIRFRTRGKWFWRVQLRDRQ